MTKLSRLFFSLTCSAAFDLSVQAAEKIPQMSSSAEDTSNLHPQDIIKSIKKNIEDLKKPLSKSKTRVALSNSSLSAKTSAKKTELPQEHIHTTLSLNTIEKDPNFDFVFERGIPFFAIFSRGKDWYLALSFPSTFEIKNKDHPLIPQNLQGKLEAIKDFQHRDGLLVKMSFKEQLYPQMTFSKEKSTLSLRFTPQGTRKDLQEDILFPRNPKDPFQIRMPNGRVLVHFVDPESDIDLWVVTAEPKGSSLSYIHERKFPEFHVLNSYEGSAVSPHNDDIHVTFTKKNILISNPLENTVSLLKQRKKNPRIASSFFQGFNPKESEKRLLELSQLSTSIQSETSETIETIWIYLGLGKVSEALSLLNRLKEVSNDLMIIPAFRAMDGLSQLLMGRGNKAAEILTPLAHDHSTEIWCIVGKIVDKKNLNLTYNHDLIHHKDELLTLPAPLFKNILSQILQAGLMHRDLDILRLFGQDSLFKPTFSSVADKMDSLGYYRLAEGVIDILKSDRNTRILEEMSKFLWNNQISTIAKFELLQLHRRDRKISPKQEFKELEALRFEWRGDILEYKVSMYLAQRYIEEHQYQKALPLLRKISEYFPEKSRQDMVPQTMQKAVVQYFSQSPFPPLLQSLSIFQEFADIVPDSKEADMVMIRATNQLVKINLLKDARKLLTDHIAKKCKNCKKGKPQELQDRKNELYYCIAYTYYIEAKYSKMFETLNHIHAPSANLLKHMNLMKSEAYEKEEDIDRAISVLGQTEAELTRAGDLYFIAKNWDKAIPTYENLTKLYNSLPKKEQTADLQNKRRDALIHLALCYVLDDKLDKLSKLHKDYAPLFEKTKEEEIFKFLTLKLTLENNKNLSNTSALKAYLENIRKIFQARPSKVRYLIA